MPNSSRSPRSVKSERIEVRISSQVADEIRQLAHGVGETVSDFIRTAAIERAERLRRNAPIPDTTQS